MLSDAPIHKHDPSRTETERGRFAWRRLWRQTPVTMLRIAGILFPTRNGEGGIRTPGTNKGTTVFETVPISHSGTSPIPHLSQPQNYPAELWINHAILEGSVSQWSVAIASCFWLIFVPIGYPPYLLQGYKALLNHAVNQMIIAHLHRIAALDP